MSGLFGLLILWKHDAESMWVVTGSVLNAMLSKALKRILNHERPVAGIRSDPGMPSSHAQSIFYIDVTAILLSKLFFLVNFSLDSKLSRCCTFLQFVCANEDASN